VNEGVINKDVLDLDRPYVEINASRANIMQGHNVFGSDSLYDCAMAILTVLYEAHPKLCSMIDPQHWEVIKMDITYSAKAKSLLHAQQFIEAMKQVSVGQLKASNKNHYDSTCYWNSGSRARSLKLYEKHQEIMQHLKALKRQGQQRAIDARMCI
jgi:II/X family phage/plasmid replication protein